MSLFDSIWIGIVKVKTCIGNLKITFFYSNSIWIQFFCICVKNTRSTKKRERWKKLNKLGLSSLLSRLRQSCSNSPKSLIYKHDSLFSLDEFGVYLLLPSLILFSSQICVTQSYIGLIYPNSELILIVGSYFKIPEQKPSKLGSLQIGSRSRATCRGFGGNMSPLVQIRGNFRPTWFVVWTSAHTDF